MKIDRFILGGLAAFGLLVVLAASPLQNPGPSVSDDVTWTGTHTNTAQPCFLAYNAATDDNQTGNGATATVDFSTEVYDQGSDFASDTFTAPVTGRYLLTATVLFTGVTAAADSAIMNIVTNNRGYQVRMDITDGMPTQMGFSNAVIADMTALDTATITLVVAGESSDVVDIFGSSNAETQFSGCLIS